MIDPNRTCATCALYSEAARPGEAKTPARGGWCLAPVPAWARVAMDDARTLPTRGAECWLGAKHQKLANLARAALRWKACAETAEYAVASAKAWKERSEAAEAERDDLRSTHERDMCADGHERIRYTPGEDFGPCPVCKLKAERDSLRRQLAQAVKAR